MTRKFSSRAKMLTPASMRFDADGFSNIVSVSFIRA
jgi:hypothetical protein